MRLLPLGFVVCCLLASLWNARGGEPEIAADTFSLKDGRAAGGNLIGETAEAGGGVWGGFGVVTFTPDGAVTTAEERGAMGILPLPSAEGKWTLSSDVQPRGSGFTALAFLPDGSPSNFWHNATLWVFLKSDGSYELRANGLQTVIKKGQGSDYGFDASTWTHIELDCDAPAGRADLKINGTSLVEGAGFGALPPPTHAAFRFNEPITAGEPLVDNFRIVPGTPAN